MNPLVVELIGVLARWALSVLGGYLVVHHILTPDQSERFTDGAVRYVLDHALLWGSMLAPLVWGIWAKCRSRVKFLTALEMPAGSSEAEVKTEIKKFGPPAALVVLLTFLALGLTTAACAKPRHIAVAADVTLSSVVFALDDAQWQACHETHVISAEACIPLDAAVKKALLDVKALTAAIQATPKDGQVPVSLPALLADLAAVRKIVDALGTGPAFVGLSTKVNAANDTVVGLLTKFAGGQ